MAGLFVTPAFTPLVAGATTKTFVVTSTGNSKDVAGTLTWAVYQANYQGGDINYINFNIPGATGDTEIVLSEPLYIARPTVINAGTQSGNPAYAGLPLIRINCNRFGAGFTVVGAGSGLPGGGGSTIQGFRFVNFTSTAISVFKGADSNTIANNHIGFTPAMPAGTFFRNITVSPQSRGIGIQSSSNIVRANIISGVDNAIVVGDDIASPTGTLYKSNVFERNFIGTDAFGMTKVGNNSHGIFFGAGSQENLVGPGNVISGMASTGVQLLHPTVTGNRIFGNMIGLNASGTEVISNGDVGVAIANGATNNWVGGPYGGAYPGNVISGNGFAAVGIGNARFPGSNGTNNNFVEGNFIGTDGTRSKSRMARKTTSSAKM
ncbi:MAG: hypothetical protein H0W20_05975 [Chthoniobacterales bacterium]|nr:hypothetical protein [Chthoniobacterales bacterium]